MVAPLIFCKHISLGSRLFNYLYNKVALGGHDKCICLYNSLNWDDYNAETRQLLSGNPGSDQPGLYCQIAIGMDTLSVGVDMPAIEDRILIGDVDDSDEAFQKWGRLGCCWRLITNPHGIIYTTAAVHKAAEVVIAAANPDEDEVLEWSAVLSKKKNPPAAITDLSWPMMLVTKCKSGAQNGLYNMGIVGVPCACSVCWNTPDLLPSVTNCNCSGCVPKSIQPPPQCPLPPTILSMILTSQCISIRAWEHGEKALLSFCKEVWQGNTSNHFLTPDIYLPDKLIKDILDHFLLLDSWYCHLGFPTSSKRVNLGFCHWYLKLPGLRAISDWNFALVDSKLWYILSKGFKPLEYLILFKCSWSMKPTSCLTVSYRGYSKPLLQEKLTTMEDLNMHLIVLLGLYHSRQINEFWWASLLKQMDPNDMPCLSQAGWLFLSPSRPFGQWPCQRATYLLTLDLTDDQDGGGFEIEDDKQLGWVSVSQSDHCVSK